MTIVMNNKVQGFFPQ